MIEQVGQLKAHMGIPWEGAARNAPPSHRSELVCHQTLDGVSPRPCEHRRHRKDSANGTNALGEDGMKIGGDDRENGQDGSGGWQGNNNLSMGSAHGGSEPEVGPINGK